MEDIRICLREPRDTDDKGDYRSLKLNYNGQVPVTDFTRACEGNMEQLPLRPLDAETLEVQHAMNIVLAELTARSGTSAFRMGSKKMFLSKPKHDNLLTGVNLHEGYFSSVKYVMDHPLLNIRTTASFSWRPMSLGVFLKERGCEKSIPRHIQETERCEGKGKLFEGQGQDDQGLRPPHTICPNL